jgi:hypothetical protein
MAAIRSYSRRRACGRGRCWWPNASRARKWPVKRKPPRQAAMSGGAEPTEPRQRPQTVGPYPRPFARRGSAGSGRDKRQPLGPTGDGAGRKIEAVAEVGQHHHFPLGPNQRTVHFCSISADSNDSWLKPSMKTTGCTFMQLSTRPVSTTGRTRRLRLNNPYFAPFVRYLSSYATKTGRSLVRAGMRRGSYRIDAGCSAVLTKRGRPQAGESVISCATSQSAWKLTVSAAERRPDPGSPPLRPMLGFSFRFALCKSAARHGTWSPFSSCPLR